MGNLTFETFVDGVPVASDPFPGGAHTAATTAAPVNDPSPIGKLRHPRAIVVINDAPLTNRELVSFEVETTSFYEADTFRVVIALSSQNGTVVNSWSWWAKQTALVVAIYSGFPINPDEYTINDLQQLIVGAVDDINFNPVTDEILLTGRDFTSVFIDTQTYKSYVDKSSSDIATALADEHDLSSVVTLTTELVGGYYKQDHVTIMSQGTSHHRTQWDLLTYLARKEGFQVFVRGQTLFFQPPPDVGTNNPYVIQYVPPARNFIVPHDVPHSNAIDLNFTRALTIAKDVIVKVFSWQESQANAFFATARCSHNKSTVLRGQPIPIGMPQVYQFTIANLTPEQAEEEANQRLREISQHELRVEAELPGDNLLDITSIIQVQGTGTIFDQRYFPDHIHRIFNIEDGYRMTVRMKNHPVDSQVSP
jgi:phage protein D